LVTNIKICFWIGKELIGRKEIVRVRSEGFLCRDKLKYRVLMMVVTETEIS